jgi:hypothetical protein
VISETDPRRQIEDWAQSFLQEAAADAHRAWRDELPDGEDPEQAAFARARRTVELVREMAAGHAFGPDGGPEAVDAFLRKQTYRRETSDARYAVQVSGGDGAPAVIYADAMDDLDIVDLLGSHSYTTLAVALRDPAARLAEFELDEIQQAILDDLYFDYDEEGVSVSFERFESGTVARVERILPTMAEGDDGEASDVEDA